MIGSKELELVLGSRHPGRYILQANPSKFEEDYLLKLATILLQHIIHIHSSSQNQIRFTFEWYANSTSAGVSLDVENIEHLANEMFAKLKNCTYPYLYVSETSIRRANLADLRTHGAYDRVLEVRPYYSEFAEPQIVGRYLASEIKNLLAQGYAVEAGQSLNPIPALYAIERWSIRHDLQTSSAAKLLRTLFPVPDIAQVEDGIVDSHDITNPEHLVSPDNFRNFSSFFWDKYFQHLSQDSFIQSASSLPSVVDGQTWRDQLATEITEDHLNDLSFFHHSLEEGARQDELERRLQRKLDETDPASSFLLGPKSRPLHLYTAQRADYSLARIVHYTLTQPEDFREFVLFTNYQKYMRQFIELACANLLALDNHPDSRDRAWIAMSGSPNTNDCGRGDTRSNGRIIRASDVRNLLNNSEDAIKSLLLRLQMPFPPTDDRDPTSKDEEDGLPEKHHLLRNLLDNLTQDTQSSGAQMPTIHFESGQRYNSLVNSDKRYADLAQSGTMPSMSIVNIGVGPSNAKNITDHLAVLRPAAWLLVGHCAGVRRRQELGHYVIADGCVRDDAVLDRHIAKSMPIRFSRLVETALVRATMELFDGGSFFAAEEQVNLDINKIEQHKRNVRTGTVFTTGDRQWETWPEGRVRKMFNDGKIVAVDMETSTIVANANRHRIHSGSLLCISDKPLHGSMKMRFFADRFYKSQVKRHFRTAVNAILFLCTDAQTSFYLENSRDLHPPHTPPFS